MRDCEVCGLQLTQEKPYIVCLNCERAAIPSECEYTEDKLCEYPEFLECDYYGGCPIWREENNK